MSARQPTPEGGTVEARSGPSETVRSFHWQPLKVIPPHLGNPHSPVDKVRNRHVAELKRPALLNPFKLLFVNEDQAIVHDEIPFSFSLTRIWTAPHSAA